MYSAFLIPLDLNPRCLHVLLSAHARRNASQPRVRIESILLKPDLGLTIGVELLALARIEVDGKTPGNDEESQGYDHGLLGAGPIGNVSQDGRDNCSTAYGCDQVGSAALGVTAEAAQGERENGREDAGFEKQDDHEHGQAAPVRPNAV